MFDPDQLLEVLDDISDDVLLIDRVSAQTDLSPEHVERLREFFTMWTDSPNAVNWTPIQWLAIGWSAGMLCGAEMQRRGYDLQGTP